MTGYRSVVASDIEKLQADDGPATVYNDAKKQKYHSVAELKEESEASDKGVKFFHCRN
jgi:ureidoglycolate hydrolase